MDIDMDALRALAQRDDPARLDAELVAYLDAGFPHVASLQHQQQQQQQGVTRLPLTAGPEPGPSEWRSLDEDITYWEAEAASASSELEETSRILPDMIHETQTKLQHFLSDAQTLSIERYDLADQLATLLSELSSDAPVPGDQEGDGSVNGEAEGQSRKERKQTILEELERLQGELDTLGAALAWVTVYENILIQSEKTLDPQSHKPSPLAALPHFETLDKSVCDLDHTLPAGTALLAIVHSTRAGVWECLKQVMAENLTRAAEAVGWPLRVDYESVDASKRRAFERAFVDMIVLQNEGERLGVIQAEGLYPLQALVQPIALRFKYHFQGTRNTNRVDKPEWAFAHILDQMYQHSSFLDDYLAPLAAKGGRDVDIKSEFTMLLFPILLSLLRSRIPHLLPHPALLAHTIYQTVVFDDAVRERGYDPSRTSCPATSWEGLAGVVLRQEGWYDQWLAGEKKFAESQLNEIISSSEAWTMSEPESPGAPFSSESARQVKSLFEQITDRYFPLAIEYRLPFLSAVQLPLLEAYRARVAGSLEAFETLSSAFVRAVPGALGAARNPENARVTGGVAGLQRLLKAHVSASFVVTALRSWADEMIFVEISGDISADPLRVSRLPGIPVPPPGGSVLDEAIARFTALTTRAEDMVIRHIAVEVESDLKPHLTRRWDGEGTSTSNPTGHSASSPSTEANGHNHEHPADDDTAPDASLVHALTTFSTLLTALIGCSTPVAGVRMYRRTATQLASHITQRAVHAGWSKFTAKGGRELQREVEDWQVTAQSAAEAAEVTRSGMRVGRGSGSGGEGLGEIVELPRAPWVKLADMAAVLALPTESETSAAPGSAGGPTDSPTFSQAMAAAWTGGATLESFCDRLGVSMDEDELKGLLRRRTECWR